MQQLISKEFGKDISQEKDTINLWKRDHRFNSLKIYNHNKIIQKDKEGAKYSNKSNIYFKGLLLKRTQLKTFIKIKIGHQFFSKYCHKKVLILT